jgi:8-oxo-dGTP pyrophosphatase MutT (NUDIX family)
MAGRKKDTQQKAPITVRREVSAGGLIWRRHATSQNPEVVLVRPARKETWVLPKGHVEPGETVLDAAIRESTEESGLEVKPGEPLGDVSYVYSWRDRPDGELIRIFKRVHFYLMEYAGGNPSNHDAEIDEVAWFDIDEALRRASHKSERDLVAKARSILKTTPA